MEGPIGATLWSAPVSEGRYQDTCVDDSKTVDASLPAAHILFKAILGCTRPSKLLVIGSGRAQAFSWCSCKAVTCYVAMH